MYFTPINITQNINNEHNSSCHVEFNTPMPTHDSWQPRTNCSMRAGRHVIVNAIERKTPGGSPDVNGCVASQTLEDFTAHLEMHPLKQGSLQEEVLKKMPLGVTRIHFDATCLNPILCCLEEPKWPPMPTQTNHTSLQGVPQNTKEESTPIENSINRLNISKMCKYVMSHQTGGFNI